MGSYLSGWAAGVAWAGPEPGIMDDEVFAMLSRGFKDLTQSKFDAAQSEYEKVIRIDFDNPYANNNMAVLMEKTGQINRCYGLFEYWQKIGRTIFI